MRNEQTSKRVAKLAGRILEAKYIVLLIATAKNPEKYVPIPFADVKALAGSALTQASSKPIKPAKKVRVQRKKKSKAVAT